MHTQFWGLCITRSAIFPNFASFLMAECKIENELLFVILNIEQKCKLCISKLYKACVTLSECDVTSMWHSTEMNYYFIYTALLVTKTSLRPRLHLVTCTSCLTGITPWTCSLLGAVPPNPCCVFSNCANFSMLVSFF